MAGGIKDLHSLQPNEQPLIRNLIRIRIPFTQLVDTVRAPREDQHDRQRQEPEKRLFATCQRPRDVGPRVADHVVGEEGAKGDEDDDLDDEAGHGEVDAHVGAARRGGAQGAAGGLKDEAEDVKGDEEPVDVLCGDAGELWGEGFDAVRVCV